MVKSSGGKGNEEGNEASGSDVEDQENTRTEPIRVERPSSSRMSARAHESVQTQNLTKSNESDCSSFSVSSLNSSQHETDVSEPSIIDQKLQTARYSNLSCICQM